MILDAFRLDGKVAIVTGSGRGIGAEIAKSFAEVGASLVCVARTAEQLATTVRAVEAAGGRALPVACDLTEPGSPERAVEAAVEQFGRIDVLVNNAGGRGHVPTKRARSSDFEDAFALNLMAPFYLTRAAAPQLRREAGAVLNISSGFARVANIGSVPYGAAKAALEQATRMLAMEYAPEVRVNGIRVGACVTENMRTNLLEAVPGIGDKLSNWTPLRRLGAPEDIARAALFLCSAASSYITGKILDVDGGVIAHRSAMELIATSERLSGEGEG